MKYQGTLIAVSDMARAKMFYKTVLEQKVLMDMGTHVTFEGGLSLQTDYAELVGAKLEPREKPDNVQLYFETEDIDDWQAKIEDLDGIEFIHTVKTYPWGQRSIRFYDFDKYIVEVAEKMQ